MAEQVDITTLGIKADATSVTHATGELEKLEKQSKRTADQTDNFVKSVEREAAVLGKSRTQVIAYDAAKAGLSKTQMEQVRAAMRAIEEHERHEKMLGRVRMAAGALGAAIGISVIGALTAMITTLFQSVRAAGEAEQEQLRLAAALRATSQAAGLARSDLKALADEVAGKTFFDDESIARASSEMLIFKNVQGETFKEGIRLAADMAALYGGQVADHVKSLGKALDDPAEGLMMLERQFGKMSERQKDHIRNLMEQNRLAEAQGAVLDYVRGKVGGMAEAMNTGINAQAKNLKKEWNEFLEALGATPAMSEMATGVLGLLKTAVANLRKELDGERTSISEMSDAFTKWMGLTGVVIRRLQEWARAKQEAAKAHTGAYLMQGFSPGATPEEGAEDQRQNQVMENSYKAYKKIQEAMKQTASDAQKEKDAVAELRKWWGQLAGEDLTLAQQKYGSLDGAIKVLLSGMPTAKKAQEEYNSSLENARGIVNEALGVNKSYHKNLEDLQTLLAAGKVKTEDYVKAVEWLILNQTDAGKAVQKQNEELKRLQEEALKQYNAEIQRTTEELIRQVETMEREVEVLNTSEEAAYRKAAALKSVQLEAILAEEGESAYTRALQAQIVQLQKLAQLAGQKKTANDADNKERQRIQQLQQAMRSLAVESQRIGDILADAFGKGGSALGKMVESLAEFATVSQESAEQFKKNFKDAFGEDGSVDYQKIFDAWKDYTETNTKDTVRMFGDMAGAAKGFFKEHSTGFRVMEAVEKTFRAVELALALQSYATKIAQMLGLTTVKATTTATNMALEKTETASSVANSATRTAASTVAGVARAFEQMGVWGFIGAAAILAFMAALGANVGSASGSAPSLSEERQSRQGTGTVLGDSDAQSESIVNALEILRENSSDELLYQSAMLASLRAIESGISGMAVFIARMSALTGGGEVPEGTQTWRGSGNTFDIADAGILIRRQTVGQASRGIDATGYEDVRRTHTPSRLARFFGSGGYTAINRRFVDLEDDLITGLTRMVDNMANAVAQAVQVLTGRSATEVRRMIDAIELNIEEMSFADLRGDDIQTALQAIFSAMGDNIVTGLLTSIPELEILEEFQQVGEGAFETIIRVASGVERARATLRLWGIDMVRWQDIADKQGDVATELIRQSVVASETTNGIVSGIGEIIQGFDGTTEEIIALTERLFELRTMFARVGLTANNVTQEAIEAAGGLSRLEDGLQTYFSEFFTDAERAAALTSEVSGAFRALGLQMPTTREGFRALVEHYQRIGDTSMVARIIALAPAWVEAGDAATSAAERARRSWMDFQDLLGELFGETEADRLGRQGIDLTGRFNEMFGTSLGNIDQIVNYIRDTFSDPDTWAGLTDSQRELIMAILGLARDMRNLDTTIQTQIDPAYFRDPYQMMEENLSDFENRFGGVISEQGSRSGQLSLRSTLMNEQVMANEARMAALRAQYQGYQLPPEYQALEMANARLREQMAALGTQMGRLTVLTAQYGEETAEQLFDLEQWYAEQRRIIGNNQTALQALAEVFNQRWEDILTEAGQNAEASFQQIRQWRQSMLFENSPLTNQQRIAEALEQYRRNYEAALGGDQSARDNFTRLADQLLREGVAFWGRASPEFQELFQRLIEDSERLAPDEEDSDPPTGSDIRAITQAILTSQAAQAEKQAALQAIVEAMLAATLNGNESITETIERLRQTYVDLINRQIDADEVTQ